MTWSYDELEQKLLTYGRAASVRGNKLLKVFFGIIGVAITIIVLMIMCIISKPYATAGLGATLVAFGLLATYVIATTRAFHKVNGVFCPHCGASLVSFGNTLDDLDEDGLERPDNLECPKCRSIAVKKNA